MSHIFKCCRNWNTVFGRAASWWMSRNGKQLIIPGAPVWPQRHPPCSAAPRGWFPFRAHFLPHVKSLSWTNWLRRPLQTRPSLRNLPSELPAGKLFKDQQQHTWFSLAFGFLASCNYSLVPKEANLTSLTNVKASETLEVLFWTSRYDRFLDTSRASF